MKVTVGSKNNVKISAIEELLKQYPLFTNATVIGIDALSNVSSQPMTLEETITGARNRARHCFAGNDYSFGLESGLMPVPYSRTGYMNVVCCAIFDTFAYITEQPYIGLSSAFELPVNVTELIISKKVESSDAFKMLGYTNKEKIGKAEGNIGILTKGRIVRKDYLKEAVRNALIQVDNKEWYNK